MHPDTSPGSVRVSPGSILPEGGVAGMLERR